MTAKEGLARLRAVRATLGEPGEWPGYRPTFGLMRDSGGLGCIMQRASGELSGYIGILGLSHAAFNNILRAYDTRDPVALDAALDALEREIDAEEAPDGK